jgi:hypothetical protein
MCNLRKQKTKKKTGNKGRSGELKRVEKKEREKRGL